MAPMTTRAEKEPDREQLRRELLRLIIKNEALRRDQRQVPAK